MDIIKLVADGFPLTIERLLFVQDAYKKAIGELASGITGNGVILQGVVNNAGAVSSGIIVTPLGEVIAFDASAFDARVAIFETVTQVPYNIDTNNDGNLDLRDSDVLRVARCAATGGVDAFNFSDLKRVSNLKNLFPIGIVLPYDGQATDILPAGWEFYDLADRFIMGAGGTDQAGDLGGSNNVIIEKINLPNYALTGKTSSSGAHVHYAHNQEASGDWRGGGNNSAPNSTSVYGNTNSAGMHTHIFSVNLGGGGQALDIRPAFKAMLFIKFVGF